MRRLYQMIALVAFMVLSTSLAALAEPAWTITPGVGAGPIKLGMQINQIEAIVHRDPNADQSIFNGIPAWIFYKEGVQVNYNNRQCAEQIYVDKPGIVTPGGVQVGDAPARFLAEYGNDYIAHELPTAQSMPNQYLYVYRTKGIGFQIEGERIKFIFVSKSFK